MVLMCRGERHSGRNVSPDLFLGTLPTPKVLREPPAPWADVLGLVSDSAWYGGHQFLTTGPPATARPGGGGGGFWVLGFGGHGW